METTIKPKTKKSGKKPEHKREYTNILEKLADGKPWKYLAEIDNDIAKAIVEEAEPNGAEYRKVINNRLRKAYGLKAPKATKKK